MSTSSTEERPPLSVVVASNGADGALERCLAALEPQLEGVELVVCAPHPLPDALRAAHPDAVWHERPGALVPVLWSDGIRRARGAAVALTISPMVPDERWVSSLGAALAEADAVGGAIGTLDGLGLADRAEHVVRYSHDVPPFAAHTCLDLPGDNAAYRRDRLDEVAETWADGFLEPGVHRALAARGAHLVHDPAVLVRMGRSAGARAFLRQRWAHGREHAAHAAKAERGPARATRLVRILAAPVVPFVLTARVLAAARRRGSLGSVVPLLPLVVAFDAAWAAGEVAGHLGALRGR